MVAMNPLKVCVQYLVFTSNEVKHNKWTSMQQH